MTTTLVIRETVQSKLEFNCHLLMRNVKRQIKRLKMGHAERSISYSYIFPSHVNRRSPLLKRRIVPTPFADNTGQPENARIPT